MNRYLEWAHIGRFGALNDLSFGPFGPGLNVVYGPNEAGKSTFASFVAGVLFGWDDAKGVRNTYRPAQGVRAGSLEFSDGSQNLVVRREGPDSNLEGDVDVVSDLDVATYRTMFLLTSDELRSLRNTSDVTARLLAAGSGANASPASAYVQIEQRIAALTAPASAEGSIALLASEVESLRAGVEEGSAHAKLVRQEDGEHAALGDSRASAAARLDDMAARIEQLHAVRARVQSIDEQIGASRAELDRLQADLAAADTPDEAPQCDEQLLAMDAPTERAVRDRLDDLADEKAKVERGLDAAQQNYGASSAAYEALVEMGENGAEQAASALSRRVRAVVSVLLPVVFVVAGLFAFTYGRQTRSLSFTILGAGMVILAFLLAAGAFMVLFRPNKGQSAFDARRSDAQWVMLQDRKKLDAISGEKEQIDATIESFLQSAGLCQANGSLRQARALLDEAREARAKAALCQQRKASLSLRAKAAEDALATHNRTRREALQLAGLAPDAAVQHIDVQLTKLQAERDALSAAYDDMNQRYGELEQRLASEAADSSGDMLKLEYQQALCRLRETKHELIELLLAKRILDAGMAAWESRNQPEVFARASQLFERMTQGAWRRMAMTPEGRLVAVSADGQTLEVRHLSLGTCQQLYLALRVALLQHASSVGRAIPVIADDILVNFDSGRRAACADVLADLARTRQVIVLTCHRDTVAALHAADANVVELQL